MSSSLHASRDPSWFNEAWVGRIKEETGDNWRIKVCTFTAQLILQTELSKTDVIPCVGESVMLQFISIFISISQCNVTVNVCVSGQQPKEDPPEHAGILPRREYSIFIVYSSSRSDVTGVVSDHGVKQDGLVYDISVVAS